MTAPPPLGYNGRVAMTLLTTKLQIPPARPDLVPRPRLLERLQAGLLGDGGFNRRLTAVAAPAGFGKSTLIGQWIGALGSPPAEPGPPLNFRWYALDEDDDDPHLFFSYLAAAIGDLPGCGYRLAALLETPGPLPAKSLAGALIQDVADAGRPLILVLDDFHFIGDPGIREGLAYLLDHMPPAMHLALTSRTAPDLPLSRLRARGQLVEIGEAELRFTLDEAAAFLEDSMGLALAPAEVAALDGRTEGWVAGLQLAAVAMQSRDLSAGADQAAAAFIASFAGDDRYVADYLAEEVLGGLPEEKRRFLLRTSLLERLNGDLADALTGRADGRATLEALQRANLFLLPLDNRRRWYRYHPLFAEMLRDRLHRLEPALVPKLHRRASDWFEGHGWSGEAIHHALAAGDLERVAGLIEAIGRPMLTRGEIPALKRWLQALPEEFRRSRPDLLFIEVAASAVADFLFENPAEMDARLAAAIESVRSSDAPAGEKERLEGELLVSRAAVALYAFDFQRTQVFCHQALEYAAEDNHFLKAYIQLGLGTAYREMGQYARAIDAFRDGAFQAKMAGNALLALGCLNGLAQLYEMLGRLSAAEAAYRDGVAFAQGSGGQPLPVAGMGYLGLAKIARERDDLATADQLLDQAIELARLSGMAGLEVDALITLGLVRRGQNRWAEAFAALEQAEAIVRPTGEVTTPVRIGAFRARLQLASGDKAGAVQWAIGNQVTIDGPANVNLEVEYLTLARILLAEEQYLVALKLLGRLAVRAEADGRLAHLIENLLLQGLTQLASGDGRAAIAAAERALDLAAREGFVRIFADEGQAAAKLLDYCLDRGLAEEDWPAGLYARRLSAIIEAENPPKEGQPAGQPLAEPLKERELQILRLIAAGLSNKEIAAELYLTVGTVKSYSHQIYGKLGVGRRTEAVERARELGLIR